MRVASGRITSASRTTALELRTTGDSDDDIATTNKSKESSEHIKRSKRTQAPRAMQSTDIHTEVEALESVSVSQITPQRGRGCGIGRGRGRGRGRSGAQI